MQKRSLNKREDHIMKWKGRGTVLRAVVNVKQRRDTAMAIAMHTDSIAEIRPAGIAVRVMQQFRGLIQYSCTTSFRSYPVEALRTASNVFELAILYSALMATSPSVFCRSLRGDRYRSM